MKNSQEWFSIKELMEKNLDLPSSDKGIVKKAFRENWTKRQREGVKGRTFEYYVGDMPKNIQNALNFNKLEVLQRQEGSPQKANIKDMNLETLTLAIETLEEALSATNRVIKPDKKAELVLAIYELLLEERNKEPVLKLIKSIA